MCYNEYENRTFAEEIHMGEVRLLKPQELNPKEEVQPFEDGLRTEAKSGSYEVVF